MYTVPMSHPSDTGLFFQQASVIRKKNYHFAQASEACYHSVD